ncbi:MAG: hypothetical protein ACK2TW_08020, partial [Anaerolineales bacterium]
MKSDKTKPLNPVFAALLSLFVPGLGQIYAGKGGRGAAILAVVIVVGNLNAIWLSLYNISEPGAAYAAWTYQLPRLLHDLFAVYGIVFWLW